MSIAMPTAVQAFVFNTLASGAYSALLAAFRAYFGSGVFSRLVDQVSRLDEDYDGDGDVDWEDRRKRVLDFARDELRIALPIAVNAVISVTLLKRGGLR